MTALPTTVTAPKARVYVTKDSSSPAFSAFVVTNRKKTVVKQLNTMLVLTTLLSIPKF